MADFAFDPYSPEFRRDLRLRHLRPPPEDAGSYPRTADGQRPGRCVGQIETVHLSEAHRVQASLARLSRHTLSGPLPGYVAIWGWNLMSDFTKRIKMFVDALAPPVDVDALVQQLEVGSEIPATVPDRSQPRIANWVRRGACAEASPDRVEWPRTGSSSGRALPPPPPRLPRSGSAPHQPLGSRGRSCGGHCLPDAPQ